MKLLHIHRYKITFEGLYPFADGSVLMGMHKRVKTCRCGATKTQIRGSW